MSVPRRKQGEMRGPGRVRHKDQESDAFCVRSTHASSSYPGVNVLPYSHSMHHESEHMPSQMNGASSSKGQQNDKVLDSDVTMQEPVFPLRVSPTDVNRLGRQRWEAYHTNIRPQRHLEMPAIPGLNTLVPPEQSKLPSSPRKKTRKVRIGDIAYPDIGHQRNPPRAKSDEGFYISPLGNRESTGNFRPCAGHRSPIDRALRVDVQEPSFLPAAPIIPRLPTPDFEPTSHDESGLVNYSFCACCTSDDDEEAE
ncbi:hypothetical protein GGS21DRAFT_488613 [Xylaria nigripes]|nr:hypothetical protein GGS21DRAFT_488613 [Xylaria nigripes]